MVDEDNGCTIGTVPAQWLDDVSPWLDEDADFAITILPRRIIGGRAVYGDEVGSLVKLLQSDNADVAILTTPDHTFESRYSAVPSLLLAVLVNIGSNAAWDSFKLLLQRLRRRASDQSSDRAEPECTVSLGLVKYPDGAACIWHEISGPADKVLDLAESITREFIACDLRVHSPGGNPVDDYPSQANS
jgi:hypothetical protein